LNDQSQDSRRATVEPDGSASFLAGGGEMGALLRSHGWDQSLLGAPAGWPHSLKTAIRIMLTFRQPIWVGWGSELTFLYNDACKAIIGGKHPSALGRPTAEVWREIWADIGPMLATAMGGGIEGTAVEEQLLIMERNGYPEETYYTFSYSPIREDDGRPGGIICANTDDTKRVVGERQLALLRDLSAATAHTRSWRDVCERAAMALRSNPQDLPFAMIYMAESQGRTLSLVGSAGIAAGHPAAPAAVPLDNAAPWPFDDVLRSDEIRLVTPRAGQFARPLPSGAWPEPASQIALLPMRPGSDTGRRGVLVVGLNRFRLFDGSYRDFLSLVAGQLAAAVANADAYEHERHAEDLAETQIIAADSFRPAANGKARILLADDNADMRDYISRLLSARHDCIAVQDGQQALESIRAQRPDLVLTDIMMPRLDGFGLIKSIRDDAQLRDLPVIVISARAGEESSVEGFASGADDYLVKPFSARELIARVDGALSMAGVRREMGEALREEARSLEILNRVGAAVAAELELERAVQVVIDSATELTGAAYGAFFYNVVDDGSDSFQRYAMSGAAREAFVNLPMPQSKTVFVSAFAGPPIVRSDDVLNDPRYDSNEPPFSLPQGRLPIRSYMTARVVSRSGVILGALFLGSPEACVFTARSERLLAGIAPQAAIAIDNARIYQAAQREIAVRARTEAALRESEERQVKLNQSLERIVSARTAQLVASNEELRAEAAERLKIEQVLRQSQKMEAVGKLTGGVAHDFNNLLQVIGGNLQLLTKDVAGNEKAEQRLRNALAGVSRGSKLAAQLLAFGRRQALAPKVVNLGRFVLGLDDLLRRALGDGVEIETVISGGLWNTLVDPSQVENAILNLAINARDAMRAHGRMTMEAGNASLTDEYTAGHGDVMPGQYVMLAVTDTGCGMTPDIVEQVFEPFFTTKPEGQGTGLGLSMVYGFVKQSGGHIKIYSEPGEGTTIRLYLPRASGAEDVAADSDAGPITGGTETVLVVEDDDEVRTTVVELLTDLGYDVLEARDAQSALAIIESGSDVDVLFTDVVMPGPVRSPELARQARLRLPKVAVLFTSGYTDDAIVHGGRLDQGIDLLSKPYTREALARKIRQVLRNQQQRASGVMTSQ
jgi:signal transduction histidine kinase/DNA-binding response OmpR family regulator